MIRGPKPHVVMFVASMLLLAGVSTVVDRPSDDDVTAITVESVAGGDASSAATASPSDAATSGATSQTPVASGTDATEADGGPSNATSTGATPTGTTSAGTSPANGSTGSSGSTSGQQPSTGGQAPSSQGPTYPEAPLYDDTEKFRGFGEDEIVMCGHAALALGAAFDTSREDLNVYWDMVNEQGGIHGRTIDMSWEDDAYVSDVAVRAATTCADKNPFMILGGIGFDQIPGVRNWAEQNRELYMHHIAVAPEETYNYSFSLSPTVQLVGQESGNYISRVHGDRKVGVIYRDRENWSPGSDAGIAVMEANGVDVTPYPVFQNQGSYANEINQMRLNGTEVVWVWENALNAGNIINQAGDQGYYPTWVVFPFQTTIDLLTEPEAHTMEGVASWSAYAPGGYGGAFPEFGVDPEIAAFEAAYAKYRPDTTPNDLLWQVWVGNKVLHRMLLDCGADCNRNRFAGMMLSGYQAHERPGCEINFSDARSFGNHHGGFGFFTQEKYQHANGTEQFRTTAYCAKTLA